MKTKIMCVIMMSILMSACRKELTILPNENEIVKLNLTVKMVEVTESPMTKIGNELNGLWGLQIVERRINANGIVEETRIGGGIYDDLTKIIIDIHKNKTYNVFLDYFPDGKNVFNYVDGKIRYDKPFPSEVDFILNQFVYTPREIVNDTHANVKGSWCDMYGETSRFKGGALNYKWSEGGEKLNIDMFNVNFAIKLIVKRPISEEYVDKIMFAIIYAGINFKEVVFDIDKTKDVNTFEIPHILLSQACFPKGDKTWWNSDILNQERPYCKFSIGSIEKPFGFYLSDLMCVKRATTYTYEFYGNIPDGVPTNTDAKFIESGVNNEEFTAIN